MTDAAKAALYQAFEDEYLPKIYGFCRMKLGAGDNAGEVEDLAQDIAYEVLRAIHNGKEIRDLGAFVWSVSNHVFCNLLRRKTRRGEVSCVPLEDGYPVADDEDIQADYMLKEQLSLLRRELAMMTGNYRTAVILHYFDGLSCEEIGQRLGRSTGTVKWWLHDARRIIKEGMETMSTNQAFGERSYRPGHLRMSCQGTPGTRNQPISCAERKSAQNILLAAYYHPVTVEELCRETGIPAAYVEDEVYALVREQLLREVARGQYQTDFVILAHDMALEMNDRLEETYFRNPVDQPAYTNVLLDFLVSRREQLESPRFNLAGFSWERLLWVYLPYFITMTAARFKEEEQIKLSWDDMLYRPDGGRWIALGFDNSRIDRNSALLKRNHASDLCLQQATGAGYYEIAHFHEWSTVNGRVDSSIFFETPHDVFVLGRAILKGEVTVEALNERQMYLFSLALSKHLFERTPDGGWRPNYYFVPADARVELEGMADELYPLVKPYYRAVYDMVLDAYRREVPAHLHGQMGNFLSNFLNYMIPCALAAAYGAGKLSEPEGEGKVWISLFTSE